MHDGSSKISIMLQVGVPSPSPQTTRRVAVEDQVRACIQRIDDGTGTQVDFLMLKRLKSALLKKERTPRVKNLLEMIEPTLRRFGYYF